jgi:hypothetical protein
MGAFFGAWSGEVGKAYGVGADCVGAAAGAVPAEGAPSSIVDACCRVVDITKYATIAEMTTARIREKSPLPCPTSGLFGSVDISPPIGS